MLRLEVSTAVRHIYLSLGFKSLMYSQFMMHGQKNIKFRMDVF